SLSATINEVADFTNSYFYDDLLRTTAIVQTAPGADAKRVEFDYLRDNQLNFVTRYASGNTSVPAIQTTYSYDGAGRLEEMRQLPWGGSWAEPLVVSTWTYDTSGRVSTFNTATESLSYGYDDAGQLKSVASSGTTLSENFNYTATGSRGNATLDGVTREYL